MRTTEIAFWNYFSFFDMKLKTDYKHPRSSNEKHLNLNLTAWKIRWWW